MITISVVIGTKDRHEHLKKCVTSLLEQTKAPKEIIIIDDGEEKRDLQHMLENELCIASEEGIDIIIVQNANVSGIVTSRNSGIKIASGAVVAFVDDDGYADKNWLKELSRHYARRDVAGVGGPVIEVGRKITPPRKKVKQVVFIRDGAIFSKTRVLHKNQTKFLPRSSVPFLQGGNMSFRKAALMNINGGDRNIIGNFYREETDLGLSVSKNGKLIFEPKAIAFHNTAKSGGCRNILNADQYIYYVFRNTTYLFFKHFDLRKAYSHTIHSLKRQSRLLRRNSIGLTRDYLKQSKPVRIMIAAVFGSAIGFTKWQYTRLRKTRFSHSKASDALCFKMILLNGTVTLIHLEEKTQLIRKLLKL